MSHLSPYAVEFVQGEAYAGRLTRHEQQEVKTAAMSEKLSKVKIADSKSSRLKAGQAYEVSLQSMLIETALSRMPRPPPISERKTCTMKGEQIKERKKRIVRPSDGNKKLSKLKKSVVNFREEQKKAAEVAGPSRCIADTNSDDFSVHTMAKLEPSNENQLQTNVECGSNIPRGQSERGSDNTVEGNEHSNNSAVPLTEESLSDPLLHPREQPRKRTPTMDRLKENLQGESLKEVEQLATELITGLKFFQDRLYKKDKIKARVRQRLHYGLKESMKSLHGQKVKMIIMARDLEAGPGGLDDLVEDLLNRAKIHRVPVVVALSRTKLKKLSQKPSKVACIAIMDPSGRDEQFKKILEIVKPLGILEDLDERTVMAEADQHHRKCQQDLETWTSKTIQGRWQFAVDRLFAGSTKSGTRYH